MDKIITEEEYDEYKRLCSFKDRFYDLKQSVHSLKKITSAVTDPDNLQGDLFEVISDAVYEAGIAVDSMEEIIGEEADY